MITTHETEAWSIVWSAIWIGALAAVAVGLIIGLVGFAVGAHEAAQITDWKKVHLLGLVFNVVGAFFAFVVGGWVAAHLAGFRRAEHAMLHGAMVWLLVIPFLLILAAHGGAMHFGTWYGGLATPAPVAAAVTGDPQLALATRNSALASVAALLLGLIGSVIGGWMASGEPMTFAYYRGRDRESGASLHRPRRADV